MLAFPAAQVVPVRRGSLQAGRNARAAKPLPMTFAKVCTISQCFNEFAAAAAGLSRNQI